MDRSPARGAQGRGGLLIQRPAGAGPRFLDEVRAAAMAERRRGALTGLAKQEWRRGACPRVMGGAERGVSRVLGLARRSGPAVVRRSCCSSISFTDSMIPDKRPSPSARLGDHIQRRRFGTQSVKVAKYEAWLSQAGTGLVSRLKLFYEEDADLCARVRSSALGRTWSSTSERPASELGSSPLAEIPTNIADLVGRTPLRMDRLPSDTGPKRGQVVRQASAEPRAAPVKDRIAWR